MVKRAVLLAAAGFAILCFVVAPAMAQQPNVRNRNRRVIVAPRTLGAGSLIARQRRAVHKRIIAMERQKQRLAKKGRNLNKGRGSGNRPGGGSGRGG